jgi:hypothetical protein
MQVLHSNASKRKTTMTTATPASVRTRVSEVADDAREAATHAIDSGKQLAAETAGKIRDTAADMRDGVAGYANAGLHYVAREPAKSALAAAAVGAVAAALVMWFVNGRGKTEPPAGR